MSLVKMKDKMEKFNRQLLKCDKQSITNYFEGFSNGRHTKKYVGKACYAPHLYCDEKREFSVYIGVSTHYVSTGRGTVPKEQRRAYFKYLMTEHPLSHLYYKTSMKFADEQGMFVKTGAVPCNQLGYALKAIRIGWEHPRYISSWYKLINAGMDKRAAAMVAGVLYIEGDLIQQRTSIYCHNIFNGLTETGKEFNSYLLGAMEEYEPYNEKHKYDQSYDVFPRKANPFPKLWKECATEVRVEIGRNPFTGKKMYKEGAMTMSLLVAVINKYVEKVT